MALATPADVVVATPPATSQGTSRRSTLARRRVWDAVVLGPFVAFLAVFLLWPTVVVVTRAITPDGQLSLSTMSRAVSGPYRTSFVLSLQLALLSSLIGGSLGFVTALVLRGVTRPRWLRSIVDGWAAVASQMGGIPLAFAFIATLGTQGLVTKLFASFGWDLRDSSFSISEFQGWVFVYLYFQIPLMLLVMMPAVEGIRSTWEEAAASLSASRWRFWRHVGLPLLAPSLLAGFVLLFVNAFTAYATAYALSSGAGQLVPLQIRFVLQGNVISGEQDLGYALVTWTILMLVAALAIISMLQRRVSRWNQR
jgi:putative spermidine/putrescine transport system permease protein